MTLASVGSCSSASQSYGVTDMNKLNAILNPRNEMTLTEFRVENTILLKRKIHACQLWRMDEFKVTDIQVAEIPVTPIDLDAIRAQIKSEKHESIPNKGDKVNYYGRQHPHGIVIWASKSKNEVGVYFFDDGAESIPMDWFVGHTSRGGKRLWFLEDVVHD